MDSYKAIGVMSGSSLDGLDIAYCEFVYDKVWSYDIIHSQTMAYPEDWLLILRSATRLSSEELLEHNILYGNYIGDMVNEFILKHKLQVDLIGSHGHTVFHNPKAGYTFQLGSGEAIARKTNTKVVSDFRIGDIIHGGEGAPLVPIGDRYLFSDYDYCLNIGGIANISFELDGRRLAYDICPANQLLNYLSNQLGEPYDDNGRFAQLGKLDLALFDILNNHPYYNLDFPKSMSNQLVVESFVPLLDRFDSSVQDKLYTVCKHIAYQVNQALQDSKERSVIVTGGGAHNSFLVTAIRKETGANVIIPPKEIVDYKEALIFAFLGVLKVRDEINCLASATGARKDNSSGIIHQV